MLSTATSFPAQPKDQGPEERGGGGQGEAFNETNVGRDEIDICGNNFIVVAYKK